MAVQVIKNGLSGKSIAPVEAKNLNELGQEAKDLYTSQQDKKTAAVQAAPASTYSASGAESYTPANAGEIKAPTLTPLQSNENYIRNAQAALDTSRQANLKNAYAANEIILNSQREKIAPTYQSQRNAAGAESERGRQAFNEYAAASGLNTGAGGQAELARQNTLAGNLSSLNQAEADAYADADMQLALLKTQYQNDIAAALSQGQYELAQSLLEDHQRVQQSVYDTALNQWNIDYQANNANYNRTQDAYMRQWNEEARDYDRAQDAYLRAWNEEARDYDRGVAAQQRAASDAATAQERIVDAIYAGVDWRSLPAELIALSGYSEAELNGFTRTYQEAYALSQMQSYSGSSGRSGSGGSSGSSKSGSGTSPKSSGAGTILNGLGTGSNTTRLSADPLLNSRLSPIGLFEQYNAEQSQPRDQRIMGAVTQLIDNGGPNKNGRYEESDVDAWLTAQGYNDADRKLFKDYLSYMLWG